MEQDHRARRERAQDVDRTQPLCHRAAIEAQL
jgi:hypothetical protein